MITHFSATADNRGVNGATTENWAENHEGTPLYNLLESIGHGETGNVSIMLGTNDAKPFNNVDAATYQSNLQSIITALVGAGVAHVTLNQPPYIQASGTGLPDPTSANALLLAYQTSLANLVTANPGVVKLGDTTAYSVFAAHPEYYQADGIHPNDVGATALAELWRVSYHF